MPFLRRNGIRLRRDGRRAKCRAGCCGPPPPPPCGECFAAPLYDDCGCGTTLVECCRCAAEFHFALDWSYTRTVHIESDSSGIASGVPFSCHSFFDYSEQVTFHLVWVRTCVDNHFVNNYTGSHVTVIVRRSENGGPMDEDRRDYSDTDAWNNFAPPTACGLHSTDFFDSTYTSQNTIGTCCSNSGTHTEGRAPSGHCITPGYSNNPPGCVQGSITDASTWFGTQHCNGGEFHQTYNNSFYGTLDNCQNTNILISGIQQSQETYDSSGSWAYTNDSACPVDPCGPPLPTGACCLSRPYYFGQLNCIETTRDQCVTRSGSYRGDGTTCDTVTPPCLPFGACCFHNGGCRETTQFACLTESGTWRGPNTRCPTASEVPCGSVGACCHGDGTCTFETTLGCAAVGGTYMGDGTLCANVQCGPPPTGACCVGTTCSIQTQAACGNVQGVYLGNGTTCSGSPCGTGACCYITGDCAQLDSEGCRLSGGYYQGNATNCATAGCNHGTCCCTGQNNEHQCFEGVTQDACFGGLCPGMSAVWAGFPAPTCEQFGCGSPKRPSSVRRPGILEFI